MRAALAAVPIDGLIRVVRTDGQAETMSRPRVVGDTLMGFVSGVAWDGQMRKLPVDSIAGIREQHFDGPGTAKLVGATLVSGVVLFAVGIAIALGGIRD